MSVFKNLKNSNTIYGIGWATISLFYFYQYILRVSPGIMVVELRQIFKLTAQEFSSLGSIYLLSYSLLQVPIGFILDRIGVRRVIMGATLICILGTIIFALASNVLMLQIGRFLIGLGSAPAFICALKLVHDHLPEKYQGFFMGATLSIGTLGALLSGKSLVTILENNGWQNTLFLCAGLGLIILTLVYFFVPRSLKAEKIVSTWEEFKHGVVNVLKEKEIIIYSVIAISVYTPLCVLADLWGTTFLMEKFSLSRAKSAELSLYLYGGLTVGSLILPWASTKWGIYKEVIQFCAVGIMVSLMVVLYADTLSISQLTILLTLIGAFCGGEMICFAAAALKSPAAHSGLTLGIVNTLNMLGGAIVQQLIGYYLDFKWSGHYSVDGARFYSAPELSNAFSLLVYIIFACALLSFALPKKPVPSKFLA